MTKPFGLKAQEKFRGDLMGKQMHGIVAKKVRRVKGESYQKGTKLVRFTAMAELRWDGYGVTEEDGMQPVKFS